MKPSPQLERIFIHESAKDHPVTGNFLDRLPDVPAATIPDMGPVFRFLEKSTDPAGQGKKTLLLTKNRGRFLKPCPGTRFYRCCGYRILHVGSFCFLDCSYCVLQAYFHPPVLTFFVNTEELFHELDQSLSDAPSPLRIGTGEFTDSLIWEPLTDLNQELVKRFSVQNRAVLELKTKTARVEKFRNLDHNRKTIMSWSVNTLPVIACQERGTAGLHERLEAAALCQEWGFPLSFHFDPLILYPGCERDYAQTIEALFSRVSPENVVWISLGAFRYMPDLKPLIEKRFADSKICCHEFIRGLDAKMRYFKPLRMGLFQSVIRSIRKHAPDVRLYFCMEDDEVWEKCLGHVPAQKGGLSKMLDLAASKICGIV